MRREDVRFTCGLGRYTADISLPGQLHASFHRSAVAHAKVTSINCFDAAAMDGVRLIVTGRDVRGVFDTLQPAISYAGRGNSKITTPVRPVLAFEQVRFVGEEIAVVVADTANQAVLAADAIKVEYLELPVVIGIDQALSVQKPTVHKEIPGNICFDFDYGDQKETDRIFATSDIHVAVTVDSPRVSAAPMEIRSALASYDAHRHRYEIYCPNQGAGLMADQLAVMLRTSANQIVVHPVDVGGGFGPRAGAYPEYAVLLYLARKLRRPIKWTGTRSEDFQCDSHGRAIRIHGELALDSQGHFLALRTDWLCDQGAYHTLAGPRTATINGQLIAAGPYRIRALYGRHRLVMTNSAPTDAFRGAARPEASLILERLADEAAVRIGMDPIRIRAINAIRPKMFPYQTPTGSILDSGDYPKLLESARFLSQWSGFPKRRRLAARQRLLRGIGCALFIEPCGGGFLPKDEVRLYIGADARIVAQAAPTSNGQGHETVFPQIVAARLGIDSSLVRYHAGAAGDRQIAGNASISSRSVMAQGSALTRAAAELIERGKEIAAALFETNVASIMYSDGIYSGRHTNRTISLAKIVERSLSMEPNPLETVFTQAVPRAFSSGAHVAEVEIDPDTGSVRLVSFIAVDDIGTVINHALADGQVHGGVVQAAGQVFGEQCIYDSSGQLLSGSLMDYIMPRAETMPSIQSEFVPTWSPTNVLGAKGVGEAGVTGGVAAIMNAIVHALRSAGIDEFQMPATSDRIWRALHGGKPSMAKYAGAQ